MIRMFLALCLSIGIGSTVIATSTPNVMHNGKPFFVIGVYDYPGGDDLNKAKMKEMADSGINTIHWLIKTYPTSWPFQKMDFSRKDLDNADKLGLKVIVALNSVAPWTEAEAAKNLGSNPDQFKHGSDLYKRLMKTKDHPAVLMYETMDEPAGCRVMDNRPTWPSLDTLRSCYKFIKSVDPERPIWCNEVAWFWCHDRILMDVFREWSSICDIYSQDDYPVGGPAYPYIPMFVIADDLDNMRQIVDADGQPPYTPAKPLMMVIQGQGRNMCAIDRPEIHMRNPNRIENRFAAYSSIIHGAKGILWWGSRDLEPLRDEKGRLTANGEFWEIIKSTAIELDVLKDAFLNERKIDGFTLGDKRLDAAMFESDGRRYLIVSNKSEFSILDMLVTVTDPKWRVSKNRIVDVMFEKRKLDVDKDNVLWHDSFAPWDVHVYTDASGQQK